MGKQTSLDVRELVLKYYKKGKTLREIGLMIDRSHNTVKHIIGPPPGGKYITQAVS